MRIITVLEAMGSQASWISENSGTADTATIFNPLCNALTANGARVLLIDANTVPTLCQGDHLLLRAQHGFLKSLWRGVVRQDALSQFSRPPQGAPGACLHLLRATTSDQHKGESNGSPDVWPWPERPTRRITQLIEDLRSQAAYDEVIIDARCAIRTIRRAAVAASHLVLTFAQHSAGVARPWAGVLAPRAPDLTADHVVSGIEAHRPVPAPKFKDGNSAPRVRARVNPTNWTFVSTRVVGADTGAHEDEWDSQLDAHDDVASLAESPCNLNRRSGSRNDVLDLELLDVLLDPGMAKEDAAQGMRAWVNECSTLLDLVRLGAKEQLPNRARVWMPTSFQLSDKARLAAFVVAWPRRRIGGRTTAALAPRSTRSLGVSSPPPHASAVYPVLKLV